jgi:hypothetical protein
MRCLNLDDDCMSVEQPAEQPREIAEDIVAVAAPPTPAAVERPLQEQTASVANGVATIVAHVDSANTMTNGAIAVAAEPSDITDTATHDVGDHAATNTVHRVEDVAPQRQPPPPDPRRRLRELLAIPDRDRSDALWDELIELEIQLAPGNRISPAGNEPRQKSSPPGRFTPQGRRPDGRPDAGGVPRQNRPHVQGNPAQNGQPGASQGQGAPAGAPGTARPAKRFFKKVRRTPRPVG